MASTVTIDLRHVARGLDFPLRQVQAVVELLDEGNTVPFITRYRKDQTGGLDEEQIREIQDRLAKMRLLADRKQTILRSIEAQGKLSEKLAKQILSATTTKRLEDLYLPYKPKKQTLATLARSRGLEELATEIFEAAPAANDLDARARDFANPDRQVPSGADALLGAGHILAEQFSERADLRQRLREILQRTGKIVTTQIVPDVVALPAPVPVVSTAAAIEEPTPRAETAAGPTVEPVTIVAEPQVIEVSPQAVPGDEPAARAEQPQAADVAGSAVSLVAEAAGGPCAEASESPPAPVSVAEVVAEKADLPPAAEKTAELAQTVASLGGETANDLSKAAEDPPAGEAAAAAAAPAEKAASTAEAKPPLSAAAARRARDRERAKAEKQQKKEAKRKKIEERRIKAFRDYFNYSEDIKRIPPHRVLAINRAERAKILRVKIDCHLDAMFAALDEVLVAPGHPHADYLRGCARDALSRLILPALEREARRELTDRAEAHAVSVFARNLRNLLLQPPVHNRRVLAVDPGFKSGCKLAALDEFGNVLGHDVIYLVGNKPGRKEEAKQKVMDLIGKNALNVVAIGNGTGCRETEDFFAELLGQELKDQGVAYVIVNEAGASVYSTSQLGREEFPTYDAALRGAVSIGRRLLDPLSELVKIEPANIGVGLYQHDVKAKHLEASLDEVVVSCVNYVGVNVNTASPALLRYVSGLNQLTARRVYEYRREHGPFRSREQLREVAGFGEATFIQAAGFLQIAGGENPLDATWIHPESYDVATQVLQRFGGKPADLLDKEATAGLAQRMAAVDPGTLAKDLAASVPPLPPGEGQGVRAAPPVSPPGEGGYHVPMVGVRADVESAPVESPPVSPLPPGEGQAVPAAPVPTAEQPVQESLQAGNEATIAASADPAAAHETVAAPASSAPASVSPRVPGVPSVGTLALRDILAQLARPGRDPREDLPAPVFKQGVLKLEDLTPGMELTGTVLNVVDFGCFVNIGMHDSGLVHVSRLADRFIRDPHEVVAVGDVVKVWVMEVDKERRRVSLTMVRPGSERSRRPQRGEGGSAEQGQQAGHDQGAPDQAGRESRGPGRERGRGRQGDRPPRGGQGRPGGGTGQQGQQADQQAARPQGGRPPGRRPDYGRRPPQGGAPQQAGSAEQGAAPQAEGGPGGKPREDRRGGYGDRPPRRPRPQGPGQTRPHEYKPKPKPLIPITDAMKKGKEPMRTFGDLMQFFGTKPDEPKPPPDSGKRRDRKGEGNREEPLEQQTPVAPDPAAAAASTDPLPPPGAGAIDASLGSAPPPPLSPEPEQPAPAAREGHPPEPEAPPAQEGPQARVEE